MRICFTCAHLKRPDSDSTSVNRCLCTALTTNGTEINPYPVGKCASWERKVSDPENSCEDCADVAICDATRMAGCADFERKFDEVEPVDDDAEHSCSECAKKDWDLCGGIRLDEGKHKCGVFEPKGECKDCADKVLCGKPSILLARTGCSSFRPHKCADFEPKKAGRSNPEITESGGEEMDGPTCEDCKFHRDLEHEEGSFECILEPKTPVVYMEYATCGHFVIGESESTRYFHSWDKKTGEYTGTVETDGAGDVGLSKYYDYEEYEPPKRPCPDGWHLVTFRNSSNLLIREKRNESVYNDRGNRVDYTWSDYKVIARTPEIIWLDGREDGK